MGQVKRMWEESLERGWDAPDKFVCANCVDSKHLKNVIRRSSNASHYCNYCRRRPAAHLSDILQPIGETLNKYFLKEDEAGIPRDASDWAIRPMNTYEALILLPLDCNDDLLKDLANAFHNDSWISKDAHWATYRKHERLANAWDNFEEIAKHRARYFLGSGIEIFTLEPDNEYLEPPVLLKAVDQAVRNLKLICTLGKL